MGSVISPASIRIAISWSRADASGVTEPHYQCDYSRQIPIESPRGARRPCGEGWWLA